LSLLVAEGINGGEAGGAASRVEAEDNADEHGDADCDEDGRDVDYEGNADED